MSQKSKRGRDYQAQLVGKHSPRDAVTTLFLCNRMNIRGKVVDSDPYVMLVQPADGDPPMLVYKSAVVSVSMPPNGPRRERRRPPDAGGSGEMDQDEGRRGPDPLSENELDPSTS